MELAEYLEVFMADTGGWTLTLRLESMAKNLLRRFELFGDNPDKESLGFAMKFLIDVERWKQMCLQARTGYAGQNDPSAVWASLYNASRADSDLGALRSVTILTGFGSTRDPESGQHRAKQASAVLRFLDPGRWGVVDWRNAAMLGLYERNGRSVEATLTSAKGWEADHCRDTFDLIDEKGAAEYQKKYRRLVSATLPRVADVDMALFGMSLVAWPLSKAKVQTS